MATRRTDKITPRWLKLKDAALYSAIGEKRLLALAESGEINGFRDPDTVRNDWIFDRESIDSYREGQGAQQDSGRSVRAVREILVKHEIRQRTTKAGKKR